MSSKDNIRQLIVNHNRRLQKLKEQAALEGRSVDPKILIEIEDIEAKVEKLQNGLKFSQVNIEKDVKTQTKGIKSVALGKKLLYFLIDMKTKRIFQLNSEVITIGRNIIACDIVLNDGAVSRTHCRLRQVQKKDTYAIYDMGAVSGIQVNGRRVDSYILEDRDEITIGTTVLRFMMARKTIDDWLLSVKKGSRIGKNYHLHSGVTTIGRDTENCDIVLDDTEVSLQHCEIHQSEDEKGRSIFTLYDLDTAFGTEVNSTRVSEQVLMNGDEITIGRAVLIFKNVT